MGFFPRTPFPVVKNTNAVIRDGIKTKAKVKGNGQECPFHTS